MYDQRYLQEQGGDGARIPHSHHGAGIRTKTSSRRRGTSDDSQAFGGQVGIKNRYSSTQIDVSKNTFKEAIERKNYIKDECWINSIYDFYKDSLLRPDKKRNLITREIIS